MSKLGLKNRICVSLPVSQSQVTARKPPGSCDRPPMPSKQNLCMIIFYVIILIMCICYACESVGIGFQHANSGWVEVADPRARQRTRQSIACRRNETSLHSITMASHCFALPVRNHDLVTCCWRKTNDTIMGEDALHVQLRKPASKGSAEACWIHLSPNLTSDKRLKLT